MDDSFVNLGEEVILTLLWQSGASESATVCFVISLSICYLLFKWGILRVVCVCVCVCARSCVCVCVREREREREKHVQPIRNHLNRGLLANTHEHHHCVCLSRDSVPFFRLELTLKLRTLLTFFTLILKDETRDYGKGRFISDMACGVPPITMLWVSWPIRADCACRKEGLCRKQSQDIEDLQ